MQGVGMQGVGRREQRLQLIWFGHAFRISPVFWLAGRQFYGSASASGWLAGSFLAGARQPNARVHLQVMRILLPDGARTPFSHDDLAASWLQVQSQAEMAEQQRARLADLDASLKQWEQRCSELRAASAAAEARTIEAQSELSKANANVDQLAVTTGSLK